MIEIDSEDNTLLFDSVLKYAKFLLSDYGITIAKYKITSGGSNYRGHIFIDVGEDINRIPKEVIEELTDFAGNCGRVTDNFRGYTIEFKNMSSE
ncbi:hypothetical protein [Methanosarcina sp. UBA411]|jgi:hypothetical protein|uniref:hypothetical protein n=1 Tax=Methanosarcina sp. UBA411 TaxID=1915589 RepID=UPI0025FA22F5|nr:hypothetical protein [Methanosarcina sp. UBA411]